MAKEKTNATRGGWLHFVRFGLYKRNQGRITRQVSFAVLVVVIGLAAWKLYQTLSGMVVPGATWLSELESLRAVFGELDSDSYSSVLAFGIGLTSFLLGTFISYRVVNLPRFADFLISVEAEMNKVSWPSQGELIRSSIVVIVVIFFLALTLFVYDVTWSSLFKAFGISPS